MFDSDPFFELVYKEKFAKMVKSIAEFPKSEEDFLQLVEVHEDTKDVVIIQNILY